MTKKLNTLVEDIFDLFNPTKTHEPCEDNLEEFAETLKDVLRKRLSEREKINDPLRFSSLGKPDRQIWYASRPDTEPENLKANTYFKFLYGDVIEALVLFLAKEAGHSVEQQQAEIEVDGVKGHIDAIIDGTVVDVKSASPFGFKKFEKQELLQNDPFGYVQQLSGYANVLTPGESAAFLAFDKVSGDICLSPLSATVIKDYPPDARISHLKEVISRDEPPARCYEDEPDGKSGNRKLGTGCSYCAYKHSCWPNLRTFIYSTGPRYLTAVGKVPDVPEYIFEGFTN